jgi:hypothetical protein
VYGEVDPTVFGILRGMDNVYDNSMYTNTWSQDFSCYTRVRDGRLEASCHCSGAKQNETKDQRRVLGSRKENGKKIVQLIPSAATEYRRQCSRALYLDDGGVAAGVGHHGEL